ncbi:hypothetical protein LEP1GSC062_3348 [Leptospira alexanderi serovar Manhao 3 str. L 60]|uniref:Uncharacterized protein n=1 Tax=Leptospira alexanderi serovar Manhao 3 str. L 60 TaxID=1049759 RepID=V6HYM8_9LEPT|nr:hypothetical protein LEP1GSC062_3348 [Leptospira alexanderi serovar Manhao 3 str. L 60]
MGTISLDDFKIREFKSNRKKDPEKGFSSGESFLVLRIFEKIVQTFNQNIHFYTVTHTNLFDRFELVDRTVGATS